MVTKESPLKSSLSALGIELSHPSMPSTVFPRLLCRAPDISGVHAALFAFKGQILGARAPLQSRDFIFPKTHHLASEVENGIEMNCFFPREGIDLNTTSGA
ncbi:hypothetical protein D5086_023767 [Populus alba]|uniref:Uncharacterized protein n=1 Tax=Populus alba TaxID=43335 RepID=A0ACC4BBD2_POPAL